MPPPSGEISFRLCAAENVRIQVRGTVPCGKCGMDCVLSKDKLSFRCRRRYSITKTKRKGFPLNAIFTLLRGIKSTWFENSYLKVEDVSYFVIVWLSYRHPRHIYIGRELGWSSKTVVDWSSFCREVSIRSKITQKLGGPGMTVEIDEAKIGKRKYNRGRLITEKWIFGGIEHGSGIFFILPVPEKTPKIKRQEFS